MSNTLHARYERALDLSQWYPAGYPRTLRPLALQNPPDSYFDVRVIINDDEALFWANSKILCLYSGVFADLCKKAYQEMKQSKVKYKVVAISNELRMKDFVNIDAHLQSDDNAVADGEARCGAGNGPRVTINVPSTSKVAHECESSSQTSPPSRPPPTQPWTLPSAAQPKPIDRGGRGILTIRVNHDPCFIPMLGLFLTYLHKEIDPLPLLQMCDSELSTFTAAYRLHTLSAEYEAPILNYLAAKHIRACLRKESGIQAGLDGLLMSDLLEAHRLNAFEQLKRERKKICEVVSSRVNTDNTATTAPAASGPFRRERAAKAGQRAPSSSQPSNDASNPARNTAAQETRFAQPLNEQPQLQNRLNNAGRQAKMPGPSGLLKPQAQDAEPENAQTQPNARRQPRSTQQPRPISPPSSTHQNLHSPDQASGVQYHSLPPLAIHHGYDHKQQKKAVPNTRDFCLEPTGVLTDGEIDELHERGMRLAQAEEFWQRKWTATGFGSESGQNAVSKRNNSDSESAIGRRERTRRHGSRVRVFDFGESHARTFEESHRPFLKDLETESRTDTLGNILVERFMEGFSGNHDWNR